MHSAEGRNNRGERRGPPNPTRWEYLTVQARWTDGRQVPTHVNEREVPAWQQETDMATVLNQLGHDGWEMVGTVRGRTKCETLLHFKRRSV